MDLLISYKGSKAVKITQEMRNGLDSYNQRKNVLLGYDNDIINLQQALTNKQSELNELNTQANDPDKKIAKEANKKIKAIEKEINKINNDIKSANDKRQKAAAKHKEPEFNGVLVNLFPKSKNVEQVNSETTPAQTDNVQPADNVVSENQAALVIEPGMQESVTENVVPEVPVEPATTEQPIDNAFNQTPDMPVETPIVPEVPVEPATTEQPIDNAFNQTPDMPVETPIVPEVPVEPAASEQPIENVFNQTPDMPVETPIVPEVPVEPVATEQPIDNVFNQTPDMPVETPIVPEVPVEPTIPEVPIVPITFDNNQESLADELNDDFEENSETTNEEANTLNTNQMDTESNIETPNIPVDVPVVEPIIQQPETVQESTPMTEIPDIPEIPVVPIGPITNSSQVSEIDKEESKPVEQQSDVDTSDIINDLNLSASDLETIWEGLKTAKESYISSLENNKTQNTVAFPSADDTLNETNPNSYEEKEQFEPIKEEKEEKTLMEIIHEEIERDIPTITPTEAYDSVELTADIYDEIGLKSDEVVIPKERDIKNLTLFKDYNDYVFTFAQQHYAKDALTPEEIDALKVYKTFLSETDFEAKRTQQYKRITNADKKLKKQFDKLTKEFKKNTDSISKEYKKNVKELTKAMTNAKKQAEIDRLEKVQTQQLNDTLSVTLTEKTTNIEDLTARNNSLQDTIEQQLKKIEELEKTNSKQADKIKDFEEKLNTVLGIVQEANVIEDNK